MVVGSGEFEIGTRVEAFVSLVCDGFELIVGVKSGDNGFEELGSEMGYSVFPVNEGLEVS